MSSTRYANGNPVNIQDVANRILLGERCMPKPVSSPAVDIANDMSRAEVEGYSICRAVNGILSQDMSEAGLEKEVSTAIEKALGVTKRSPHSFFFPTHLPFQVPGAPVSRHLQNQALRARAAYQVGTASAGGNLVGTELLASSFIEVLRNLTVTGQLGAQYLTGLVENVNIPRQNSQTQTYWVGESAALTESEATFDQVQLRPHTVGALSKMSRLSLRQATPSIEQLVRNDIVAQNAVGVDYAALFGPGTSSQPTGIANTSGVGSVIGGTNGANLTFDHLVAMYSQPLTANAPMDNLGYAFSGTTKGYLSTLKSSTGEYLWSPSHTIAGSIPDEILGYRYAVSSQLPHNLTKGTATGCSAIIFGNWKELLIAEWGVTEIMVNPYGSDVFPSGDVWVRAFQTVDVGLRHPASFSIMTDALTPGF